MSARKIQSNNQSVNLSNAHGTFSTNVCVWFDWMHLSPRKRCSNSQHCCSTCILWPCVFLSISIFIFATTRNSKSMDSHPLWMLSIVCIQLPAEVLNFIEIKAGFLLAAGKMCWHIRGEWCRCRCIFGFANIQTHRIVGFCDDRWILLNHSTEGFIMRVVVSFYRFSHFTGNFIAEQWIGWIHSRVMRNTKNELCTSRNWIACWFAYFFLFSFCFYVDFRVRNTTADIQLWSFWYCVWLVP